MTTLPATTEKKLGLAIDLDTRGLPCLRDQL